MGIMGMPGFMGILGIILAAVGAEGDVKSCPLLNGIVPKPPESKAK
jgi:hypothetical protein